jgi:hypothetical protein
MWGLTGSHLGRTCDQVEALCDKGTLLKGEMVGFRGGLGRVLAVFWVARRAKKIVRGLKRPQC